MRAAIGATFGQGSHDHSSTCLHRMLSLTDTAVTMSSIQLLILFAEAWMWDGSPSPTEARLDNRARFGNSVVTNPSGDFSSAPSPTRISLAGSISRPRRSLISRKVTADWSSTVRSFQPLSILHLPNPRPRLWGSLPLVFSS